MISNDRIGIIIQARIGSTRLPAKIMKLIKGKSILEYQLDRIDVLQYPIFIATTTKSQDDVIEEFAKKKGISFFRGDENNVLKRYYDCAVEYNLETIIRITSDCPLIDPVIIEEGVRQYMGCENDHLYLSNTLERTYPRGADFEVFSFSELSDAYKNAIEESDTEHVTPYIWKNKSGKVEIMQYKQVRDFSEFRLTLDTQEDFELITLLIEKYNADKLNMAQICDIMSENPALATINMHIEQKKT